MNIEATPKPESWPEIARECAIVIVNTTFAKTEELGDIQRLVNSSIERSHAAQPITDESGCEIFDVPGCMHTEREKNTVKQRSNYPQPQPSAYSVCECGHAAIDHRKEKDHVECQIGECECDTLRPIAQPQPSKASPPQQPNLPCGCTIEQGDSMNSSVFWNEFNRVVQCHKCGQVYEPPSPPGERSEENYDRQRRKQAEKDVVEMNGYVKQAKDKLLSALAAIKAHNRFCVQIDVDLSALREHDAKLWQLLIDGKPRAICKACGYPELIGSDDCRNCGKNFNERIEFGERHDGEVRKPLGDALRAVANCDFTYGKAQGIAQKALADLKP